MMGTRKFTQEEIGLIHRTMMAGAKSDDVALFVATCERTGLDPFARQIMPSSRKTLKNDQWITQWTWLVTIDGLRKIAVESGDYEGQEGPWWCGKDGQWKDIWTGNEPCFAAKVMVHRKGFKIGMSGIAKYESYVQKKKDGQPNQVWQTLGDHMTAKCAEALALRRAYPNETAGLYTTDEMAQAGFEPIEDPKPNKQSEEWSFESHELFNDLLEKAYNLYLQGCDSASIAKAEYQKFYERYAVRKSESAEKVIADMVAFIDRLESAAKAKKEKAA